jgi:ribosomal protein S18 acetylase RimI-like enzyme
MLVRTLTPKDHEWVVATLEGNWGSTKVARKGELLDASVLPGYVATLDGQRVGLVLSAVRGDEYEVVSISVTEPRRGVGGALLERCFEEAQSLHCRRVWLTTTNNNVAAFGFYQRLGMDLRAFYRHGVSASRRVKPAIPLSDASGLPINHELEFELVLRP